MNMRKDDIQRGRKMSLLLRHKPHLLKLSMDEEGWVDIDELMGAWSKERWRPALTEEDLTRVVTENDKKRYTIDLDNRRIRARQGHSLEVDLGLEPVEPPEKLFHGTVGKYLEDIRENGLKRISRQHVHLSKDLKTANKVGQRRGKPIILTVNSGLMHEAGYKFYLSENGVWLAAEVPAEFIDFSGTV
jgi:putative RNA 2'-phosphotransferase